MTEPGTFKSIQRVVFHDEYGRVSHILDAIDIHGNAWCMRLDGRSVEPKWQKLTPLPICDSDNETN